MSGLSSFVFFVLFLSGSTNQRPPKFSGLSTFAKKVFWPVFISAPVYLTYKINFIKKISGKKFLEIKNCYTGMVIVGMIIIICKKEIYVFTRLQYSLVDHRILNEIIAIVVCYHLKKIKLTKKLLFRKKCS